MPTFTETANAQIIDPRDQFTWNLQPVEHGYAGPSPIEPLPNHVIVPVYPGKDGARRPIAGYTLAAPHALHEYTDTTYPVLQAAEETAIIDDDITNRHARWYGIEHPQRHPDGMPVRERGAYTDPTDEETGELIDIWRRAKVEDPSKAHIPAAKEEVWDDNKGVGEIDALGFIPNRSGIRRHRKESRTWKVMKRIPTALGGLALAVADGAAASSLMQNHEPASFWSALF